MTAPALLPYPRYRPSGIPWLGDVPAHWEVRRLRNLADMRVSNVDKHSKEKELPIRLCNYVDVCKNDRITADILFMRATATAEEIARFRLECGDVLITKDSEVWHDIAVPALVEHTADDLVCGYHLALLRPSPDTLNGHYLFRALQSAVIAGQFHIEANGVTRYGLSHQAIKSVLLPLPPPDEQAAIVRYLDDADDRIRRYTGAKARLIALLEEQRQAAIHWAVTCGLNPDAPLRPSGIPWLGSVPAHWEVRRLKNICRFGYGDSLPDEARMGGSIPVYGSNGQVGWHRQSNTKGECIVIGRKWSFGKVHYSAEPVFAIDTTFLIDHRCTEANIRWLYYLLDCLRLDAVSKDSAVPGLNREDAYQQIGLYPPPDEQAAIVAHIDQATAEIDAAIARARREIALMDEYRARLIADAVTGRLDVRAAASCPSGI